MSGGAAAVSAGPAPQPALFSGLQVLTPSTTDTTSADVRANARFELHRALDRGNDADLLAWVRRWGEGLTDGIEHHVAEAEYLNEKLDESDDWSSSYDNAKLQEAETGVQNAHEAVADARNKLANLVQPDVQAAVVDLDEALKHLTGALKEIDAL